MSVIYLILQLALAEFDWTIFDSFAGEKLYFLFFGFVENAVEIFFELNPSFAVGFRVIRQLAEFVVRFGRAEFLVYLRFDFFEALLVQSVFLVVPVRLISVGRD